MKLLLVFTISCLAISNTWAATLDAESNVRPIKLPSKESSNTLKAEEAVRVAAEEDSAANEDSGSEEDNGDEDDSLGAEDSEEEYDSSEYDEDNYKDNGDDNDNNDDSDLYADYLSDEDEDAANEG
ncbi:phosphopantothenoylcysteine decarboxylase subunit VHS3-like [Rhagoletis pomonella]|uniref:phosphopantothenoylcysteine decarboxylase subunit VHS3-like n=1 Tax=Rhagoletis pomonella TaxID=28610 RepID=UPI0017856FE7|nr:phosphopantothenoylcysteine decarboxylase subunit VHS3-like [Rhagoletis pomonella]